MPFAVLVPAAGASTRFGGPEKKPFLAVDGRALWLRAVERFLNRPDVCQVILAVAPEDLSDFRGKYAANLMFMDITTVAGGAERADTVRNALDAVRAEADFVAVHDAARPLTPPAVIDAVFAAAVAHGAAVPGLPVADTLKRVSTEGLVEATVPRERLWQVQTPQACRTEWLREAYAKRSPGAPATDEASLLEAAGFPVRVVPGSARNLKVTTPADLELATLFLMDPPAAKPKARRPFDDEEFS